MRWASCRDERDWGWNTYLRVFEFCYTDPTQLQLNEDEDRIVRMVREASADEPEYGYEDGEFQAILVERYPDYFKVVVDTCVNTETQCQIMYEQF